MVGRREGVGTGRDGTGGWVGVIGSGVCRRAWGGGGDGEGTNATSWMMR